MAKYELVVTSDDALSSPLTLTVLNSVGPRGLTGPQGPQGETGPQGPAGVSSLADLSDVDGADTATAGQLLQADGDDTFSFVTVASATNTLDDVTSNGNTTTNAISVGGITATSLNTHTIPSGTGTLAKTSDIPTNNNQLTNGAGYITDYTVTQGDVTAHQAALSITESQISDLGTYLTAESDTLDSVTDRGNSTTNGVTVGSLNTHTIPGGTGTLALTSDVPTNNNQLTNGAGYITDYTVTEGDVTAHQAALSITESQISDFGTYATLVGGTVPASQLPSYVDDVLEYTNYSSFPATGETGKIYVDLATGDIYRWSGSAYVQISDAVSSADQATQLATARTISLSGDVSGSTSFDGSADVTITATVADDSHNHIISNVDGLQTALDGKLATTATTDDVSEGSTNLYYTSGRFDTAFAAKDTDDLSEGTNLYYTDTRARGAITLTSSNTNELSYNQSSGEFSYTSPSTVSQSTAVTLEVRNTTGSTIAKGVPVYIAGHSGNNVLVAPADANDSTKMPAIGLASSAINNNNDGTVTSFGLVAAIDTSSFSVGDTLYIDTTPGGTSFGGLTNSAPTGETSAIQNIGKVARSDASQGEIIVSGPGRSNATPNLATGNIFIGNASNQAVTSSLSTEVGLLDLSADKITSGTLASARLPDLAVSDFAAAAIVTEAEGLNSSDNDTSIPTTAAVKDYVDGTGSVANDTTITIAGGTGLTTGGDFTTNQGTAETITLDIDLTDTAAFTSASTASRAVVRDASGNFAAGTITANLTGDVTGTVSSLSNHDTDDLAEGTNLYYTDTRFNTAFSGKSTTDLSEGTNLYYTDARADARVAAATGVNLDLTNQDTDDLSEGSTNLYHTTERVQDVVGGQIVTNGSHTGISFAYDDANDGAIDATVSLSSFDTDDLSEGSNLYYTSARFDSAFGGKSTDNLSEGSTNLYYTDTRANSAFDTRLATKDTDALSEGSTNLYHTTERVEDAVANQFVTVGQHTGISFSYDDANDGAIDATVNLNGLDTGDLTEGSNLYFTNERVDDRVGALITDGTGVTSTYNDVAGTLTLAIGQDVSSGSSVSFAAVNAALTGNVTGDVTGDVTGNVTSTGTSTFATVDINGGAIDGTAIGANSASSVAATTLTTTGNVTIGGDLTVSGTTTTVNTETLEIADNQIVLNSNATGSPTENAGIEIERGDAANKTLIWHETDDEWTVGSETFKAGTFKGALTGDVTSAGTSTFSTVDINGGAIDGTAIGSTTSSTIAGTTISASSGFSGDLTGDVTGDLTGNVAGNITSTGASSFSNIDVNGGSIDNATIGSTTAAAITGTTITANNGFTGNITSTGASSFSNIDVNGGAIDNATIGGATPAAITGTSITANTGFSGDLTGTVTGTVSSLSNHDTGALAEGTTNLYYTDARATSNFSTNLASSDTDDLSEGLTNLYYTNARADSRITAAVGSTVQAHSSVLDATSASYTTAEETKLAGIEALADVTDTANVVAALTPGTNITIAGDGTISATDTNTTYTAGDGLSLTGTDFDIDLSDGNTFTAVGAASKAVKTDGSGFITGTRVFAGASGVGRVSMNYNDGGGHANVTFNHDGRTPDLSGNSGRIVVNTDTSGSAQMEFELASAVTAGTLVNTNPYMTLYETGLDVDGTVIDSHNTNVRSITQNSKSAAYTLVAADAGKHISTNSAVTIPNGVFSTGDAITIFNSTSSTINITAGTGITLHQAGTTNTGSRQLGSYGLCTVLCFGDGATDQFVISGVGLT